MLNQIRNVTVWGRQQVEMIVAFRVMKLYKNLVKKV
jgi:hypothetical protein